MRFLFEWKALNFTVSDVSGIATGDLSAAENTPSKSCRQTRASWVQATLGANYQTPLQWIPVFYQEFRGMVKKRARNKITVDLQWITSHSWETKGYKTERTEVFIDHVYWEKQWGDYQRTQRTGQRWFHVEKDLILMMIMSDDSEGSGELQLMSILHLVDTISWGH